MRKSKLKHLLCRLMIISFYFVMVSCHSIKNKTIIFKLPYEKLKSNPENYSSITLLPGQRFEYDDIHYHESNESIYTSFQTKGTYRIKKEKIFFFPEIYKHEKNKRFSLIDQDAENLDRQSSIATEKSLDQWVESSKEEIRKFQTNHNYIIKRDSLWKLYQNGEVIYFELDQSLFSDWEFP